MMMMIPISRGYWRYEARKLEFRNKLKLNQTRMERVLIDIRNYKTSDALLCNWNILRQLQTTGAGKSSNHYYWDYPVAQGKNSEQGEQLKKSRSLKQKLISKTHYPREQQKGKGRNSARDRNPKTNSSFNFDWVERYDDTSKATKQNTEKTENKREMKIPPVSIGIKKRRRNDPNRKI